MFTVTHDLHGNVQTSATDDPFGLMDMLLVSFPDLVIVSVVTT